jgi:hypothetical protein
MVLDWAVSSLMAWTTEVAMYIVHLVKRVWITALLAFGKLCGFSQGGGDQFGTDAT